MFVWCYKGYTISHNVMSNKFYITYPNEIDSSVYTFSLEKAYDFIDEMDGE